MTESRKQISGEFTRADLNRLKWHVAAHSEVTRAEIEADLADLANEGLEALAEEPDAVAVAIEQGEITAVVAEG